VLSIGRLAAGPTAGRYYEDAVAAGREDYYAGEGEAPGRWVGAGSAHLGMSGEVQDGEVGRLLAGEHPESEQLLGAPMGERSVAGFDLTFKAPKSVSVAYAIGDPWTTRVMRECHERAVDDALGYLEREACRARRGKNGLNVVRGEGFAAAAFGHRTSRAGDPLLHTHVVVSNRTLGPDGRWTALDARPLYRQLKTAGYLYQARLRHEITARTGARWGEIHKGAADLAGVPREVIDHFSKRRDEILREMELHDSHSLAAGNAAAVATRKGKDYGVPMERLREEWRARAAEHGLTQERIEQLLTPRWREHEVPREVDLDELTKHSSTFTRRDVLQAVCEAHPDGAANIAELEAKADQLLRSHGIVRIPDPAGELFTTERQLAAERGLLESAERAGDKHCAIADPDSTQVALSGRRLSDEQQRAVRELTSSGRSVEVLRAPAGAGKTFALDAARDAWQRSGKQVVGCALSAQAARELREQAGIETTTIADLKQRLDRGHRLPADGVLIVDEAGMVGTRDLAKLDAHCRASQTKLLLVGDDRQLPEIEAGGAFRAIAERTGAVELTEVRRQDHEWDRRALSALRDGKPAYWAAAYVEHARVKTADTAPAVREHLAADWWKAKESGADARMIAMRRTDVADLNQRARDKMRDAGRLGPDVDFDGKPFATGDEIVVGHNDRRLGVLNGDRGKVLDAHESYLDVRLDKGEEIRVPATFVRDGHVDHGYATTAHKAQGATVDEAFVLGSQEAYREWGYTALSRHREQSTFYMAAPKTFVNQEPERLDDPEQLKLALEQTFDDSRRHELATDLADRHGAYRDDDRQPTQEQRKAARELLPELPRDTGPPTEEQRRAAREILERGLDEAFDRPAPEPPGPDIDMDFGW